MAIATAVAIIPPMLTAQKRAAVGENHYTYSHECPDSVEAAYKIQLPVRKVKWGLR